MSNKTIEEEQQQDEPSVDIQINDLDVEQQQDQQPEEQDQLISQIQINQDRQLYQRTIFPKNSVFEKQKYVSLKDQQFNRINKNMERKFKHIFENIIDDRLKISALKILQEKIGQISQDIEICPYGGSQNGLSISTGDIDVTCLVDKKILQQIELEWLQEYEKYDNLYTEYNIQLFEYYSVCKRFQEAMNKLKELNDPEAIIDPEILKDRSDWQKIIFLIKIASLFDKRLVQQIIVKAKVPLLRLQLFYDIQTQEVIDHEIYYKYVRENGKRKENIEFLNIDLCINNYLPLENTQLIGEYLKFCPLMRPLVLILKNFLKAREINFNHDNKNINSYSLVLLVPNLQETPKTKYVAGYNVAFDTKDQVAKYFTHQEIRSGLAEILTVSFENQIISIRRAKLLDSTEKQWVKQEQIASQKIQVPRNEIYQKLQKSEFQGIIEVKIPDFIDQTPNNNFYLQIEDPFETNLNTTRNVEYKNIRRLKTELRRGYAVIKKHKNESLDALFLSPTVDPPGIIPEQDLQQLRQLQKEKDNHQDIEVIIEQSQSSIQKSFQFSQGPQ